MQTGYDENSLSALIITGSDMNEIMLGVLENVAATGAIAIVGGVIFRLTRFPRRLIHMIDDWFGEEARVGVPRRPGMMERMYDIEQTVSKIHHEVTLNSGSSLKDAVNRTDRAVIKLQSAFDTHLGRNKEETDTMMDRIIREHDAPPRL
jgi:hypothetical protein